MDLKKSKKLLTIIATAYWAMVILVYIIASPQFHQVATTTDTLSPSDIVGELVDGVTVTQRLYAPAERLSGISLMTATYGRPNSGVLYLTLTDATGAVLVETSLDVSDALNDQFTPIPFGDPIATTPNETLLLTLTTQGCQSGSAISVDCGDAVTAGKFDIAQTIAPEDRLAVNDTVGTGQLCVKLEGLTYLNFYKVYWVIVTAAFVLGSVVCAVWWKKAKQGKNNPLVAICTLYSRYSFLIQQLISRDFKTKYKRSVLGMGWSFLNPLLTMFVQYIVFSTLFKSNIPNYPVYLLTGIVFMNFFNEAVSMGMTSITGNASLIKKVYMPKYIYPVSRVLSSLVNFGFAIVPLFLVMAVTRTVFRPALLLLLFDILCMLGFIVGMGLLLTTAMTFFQDTQFLWGVVSMMWMYLTPVFYPESIIPENYLTLYHMNPMYQYITFARVCIIDGVSPEPVAYLWCILSAGIVLLLGVFVFKREQDKFVLYL